MLVCFMRPSSSPLSHSFRYLLENIKLNKVSKRIVPSNKCARHFMKDLMQNPEFTCTRVVMNLPDTVGLLSCRTHVSHRSRCFVYFLLVKPSARLQTGDWTEFLAISRAWRTTHRQLNSSMYFVGGGRSSHLRQPLARKFLPETLSQVELFDSAQT